MSLRDSPAWREMFVRLDAKAEAARHEEAERWARLSDNEKWAEMASEAGHWRVLGATNERPVPGWDDEF